MIGREWSRIYNGNEAKTTAQEWLQDKTLYFDVRKPQTYLLEFSFPDKAILAVAWPCDPANIVISIEVYALLS